MRKWRFLLLAAALVVLCAQPSARAHSEDALQSVRLRLSSYDLGEDGIIRVLEELPHFVAKLPDKDETIAHEVRFLRAAVTADLMFAAAYTGDEQLRARLNAVWHTPTSLIGAVNAELEAAGGIYRAPALRIAHSLQLLGSDGQLTAGEVPAAGGSRRDMLLLRRGAAALNGASAPEAVLAELGQDPCAHPQEPCAPRFQPLDKQSRLALAGLLELGQAVARLRSARAQGDPLVDVLAAGFELDFERIQGVQLRLRPRLAPDRHVQAEGNKPKPLPIDLLLTLTDSAVHYGHVPRVQLNARGQLQTCMSPDPTLPTTHTVRFPKTLPSAMQPIPELVDALSADVLDQSGRTVGITAAKGVQAHLLGRVMLSLRKVGYERTAAVGASSNGDTQSVALRILVAREANALRPAPQVQLRVRLGGYTVNMGRNTLDIPRVREAGGFRFDTDSLTRSLGRRAIRSAAVSFMGAVAVEDLLAALWRVSPTDEALSLIVR